MRFLAVLACVGTRVCVRLIAAAGARAVGVGVLTGAGMLAAVCGVEGEGRGRTLPVMVCRSGA